MVKKLLIYGTIVLVLIISGVSFHFLNMDNVKYGIAVTQDNYQSVVVNDQVVACNNETESTTEIPAKFKKVAENEQLELYLEENTVALMVKDKCNGYTWSSYDVSRDMVEAGYSPEIINFIQAGVSLVTYDKFTPNRRTILDSNVEKNYEMLDNGFKVSIDFKAQQIKFDLIVTLQGGDLLVHIPRESVDEYNPKLWESGNNNISMNEMIVYPFFGATSHKEDGYIVIPDGSGAIVNLSEKPKYTTGYSAAIYGKDMGYENTIIPNNKGLALKPLERISVPIFGVIHDANNAGMLVISESGSSYAMYNYNSRDLQTSYYQSYFSYIYRKDYSQFQSRVNEEQHILGFQEEPNEFDLTQRYVFLQDNDANYVGVAKKYRDYLEKKDGLEKSVSAVKEKIPMKIDFINNEVAMGTLGVEDVATTTYTQAKEIVNELINSGYENLDVTFKTFIQNKSGYHFDILSHLGGKDDLEDTLDFFATKDISFSYYLDYAQSFYESTKYTASKMNRRDFDVYHSSKNLFNYMNNPKYYQVLAEADIDSLKSSNISALALGGLQNSLFTHYDNGVIGSSIEGMEYTKQLLGFFQDKGISTSVYAPDAYLYSYMDKLYQTPMASSELIFVDATIPLIPLILSGYKDMYSPYMNFATDDDQSILKLIEYGIYPSFVLTGESTYKLKDTASGDVYISELEYLSDRMDTYYNVVNDALKQVAGSEMVNHEIVEPGIIKVTYSNGREILMNYNNRDYSNGEVQIKAKGFVIL
ncbi:DUF5696 domain-containing protein [Lederbergia graminis]|uniref:DUF5696 domain-containing protein n=1 Tax=Lederbergia graminis TaxID=735518 RepID=A0ABW0LGJ3_9BACI